MRLDARQQIARSEANPSRLISLFSLTTRLPPARLPPARLHARILMLRISRAPPRSANDANACLAAHP